MYEIRNPVGRLVTTRLPEPPTLADAKKFAADLARAMMAHASTRVLLCSDFRADKQFAADVTAFMVDMMRQDNLIVDRAGILVLPNTTGLQVFNAIREANAPDRRMATTQASDVITYLRPAMTPAELRAAELHLGLQPLGQCLGMRHHPDGRVDQCVEMRSPGAANPPSQRGRASAPAPPAIPCFEAAPAGDAAQ